VKIALRDGRVLSTRVDHATGEPENPVPRQALVAKFVSLASDSTANPEGLAEQILRLEMREDLKRIAAALGTGVPSPSEREHLNGS
jgi:2-methylcitrate dehydratase PrpD